MGSACTKARSRKSKGNVSVTMRDHKKTDDMDDGSDLESRELAMLQHWLEKDINMFVMTNVLLSVQFFQNYEKEMETLRKDKRENDGEELAEHRMLHFKPDSVMEIIGKYLKFRPAHGENKHVEELLHPLRAYFLYQNVLVESEYGESNVTVFDKKPPSYHLRVDTLNDDKRTEALKRAGYVNLKEVDRKEEDVIYESLDGKSPVASRRSSVSSGSNNYHNEPTFRRNSQGHLTPVRRMSTTHLQVRQEPEPTYTYTTIQRLTSPKALRITEFNIPSSSCAIPNITFTKVERQILGNSRRTGNQGPLTNIVRYLNSTQFFYNFVNVFYMKLAKSLAIEKCLNNAQEHCQRVVYREHFVTHHIMPALSIKFWPNTKNKENNLWPANKSNSYNWPTEHMGNQIKKMGMFMLPLGFLQKRGENEEFELQWQFTCPRGERYLLNHIMHSQMRCYLFALAIIKTFVPEKNTIIGLNHTHMMHLLFWQIRDDYERWPVDRPADTLLRYLKALHDAINDSKLNDFFIPSRNILESCPKIFLHQAQAVLTRIIENPLPYILIAVKQLRMRPTFYPTLDVNRIYNLLTVPKLNAYLHPEQQQTKKRKIRSDSDSDYKDDSEDSDDDADEAVLNTDQKRQWKKQYHRQQKIDQAKAKEEKMRKASVETIKLKETIKNTDKSERHKHLLQTFIDHFIKMSETSRNFAAFDQALMYIEQSKRLTKLLARLLPKGCEEIENYNKTIANEEIQVGERKFSNSQKPMEVDNVTDAKRLSYHNRVLPSTPEADTANIPIPFIQENETSDS